MFEDKLIKEIIDCWKDDQNHPQRGRAKREIPNQIDIKELIELAFNTSLLREEEKTINVSVVLVSQEVLNEALSTRKTEIYNLEEPIAATPESIAKISPALDLDFSSLLVERNSEGVFLCWGIARFDPSDDGIENLPISRIDGNSFKPDFFTITIQSPGSLLISRSNSNIGRFLNGVFTPACPTPFISHSLGEYLIDSISDSSLSRDENISKWYFFSLTLQQLLVESAKRGHGGTVVVLPKSYSGIEIKMIDFKYSLSPDLSVSKYFEYALTQHNPDNWLKISINREISRMIKFLAQLSTIDGAIVLNRDLKLLGFGATLRAPRWEGIVIEGADGFGRRNNKNFDHKKYGTRHNSAINFSGECKGAVSFVISQDGPIRAFLSNDNDKVQCWPDCTVSMFV